MKPRVVGLCERANPGHNSECSESATPTGGKNLYEVTDGHCADAESEKCPALISDN